MDEKILELYEKYETCREVAYELGITNEFVRRVLIKHGVPRTHRHPKPKTGMTCRRNIELPIDEIVELYESGLTTAEIGEMFGCSYTTVNRRLKSAGVELRSVGVKRKFDLNRIVDLYDGGMSANAIDCYLGCSHGVVSRYLRSIGVTPGKGNKLANPAERICEECGAAFTTTYRDKMYCSRSYQNAHFTRLREDKKRANGRFDYIGLHELYKRDGGVCHICGDETDWNDCRHDKCGNFIAGRNYPTRDHVVPLAKGGTHTWDNVKLAHFHCNSAKGDKLMEVCEDA